jgi:kexin
MDPSYPSQWHLARLNVSSAWMKGYAGSHVQIAIVDDGIEWGNPDLIDRFSSRGSIDIVGKSVDPNSPIGQSHGTASAAVAAASMNGWCGVGVAPLAKVAGIRLLGEKVTDADEAVALSYRFDLNSIFSNSWGPIDDGRRLEGPGVTP